VIVDDALAQTAFWENWQRDPEHFGQEQAPNLYQSETLSKAFGSYGGFHCRRGSHNSENTQRISFLRASTALPPAIVAAGCASVRLIQETSGVTPTAGR
jgi:7-keto-8-aminopelargonate synthetase-like enzyme